MAWNIEFTERAEQWLGTLDARERRQIQVALDRLERDGPALARPYADSIKGARHHNMKELRSTGGHLRALFAFDPRRQAIVLLGGDKTNDWHGFYQRNIPVADRMYDEHLRSLGGGEQRSQAQRAGARSAARGQ